ncbi:hypothetical protein [Photobacterium kishitanii]|uniref:Uncharacterized protein n=1 Tax=Photobacterium kishitanii TaxID=318456 RepID=A0A2T3KL21_9GAMM|nr:hypothetical protein [Photobacterium kishitanii]PSV00353.1 hypothetical protein C9J27_04295 [Photobacterium kishitanii]
MSVIPVKLKKTDNGWTAEDTKFLTDISIHSYGSHYYIKAKNIDLKYSISDDVFKQSAVKKWLAEYDENYLLQKEEKLREEAEEERKYQEKCAEIKSCHNEYCLDAMDSDAKVGDFITARFASANKDNTIGGYFYKCQQEESQKEDRIWIFSTEKGWHWEILNNWNDSKVKIVKIANVSDKTYDALAGDLLSSSNLADAGVTFECGGEKSDYKVNKDIYPDIETFWKFASTQEKELWKKESWLIGALIKSPNRRPFVVDTQGYSYARYVGLFVSDNK